MTRDSPEFPEPSPLKLATRLSHFAKEKKRLRRSSLHSNPACYAHTHTLTFKMVKMVESADEFKALKMGDKPVRTLPGSAPRSRTPMSAERKCCTCLFPRARGFFRRARRDRGLSRRAGTGIARSESPRARVSPGRLRTRAPASSVAPDPVDAAPIANPTAV